MTTSNLNNGQSERETADLISRIRSMRQRESRYTVSDYLKKPLLIGCDEPVDEICRSQMIQWMVNILDHCKFSRSTVPIAISFLDRFLMVTDWAVADRSAFQLASITCLYTAIKIHEPTVLSATTMAALSKNIYSVDQIETMERIVLQANNWMMNPETSYTFTDVLCKLVQQIDSRYSADTLSELAQLQLEAKIDDYQFCCHPSSSMAYAAVMNAIDSIELCSEQELENLSDFLTEVSRIDSSSLDNVRIQLYEGIMNESFSAAASPRKETTSCASPSRPLHSPRSVSNIQTL